MNPAVVRSPSGRPEPVASVIALVACLFGLGVVVLEYHDLVWVFSAAAALAGFLLLLTLGVGYLLPRRLRPVVAPPHSVSIACVVWGMTAATGCAILANTGLGEIWAKARGVDVADAWGASATAPFDEETLKLCGVILLALVASRAIRAPIDGWVYGALVGLGFQVVENFLYALDAIVLDGATDPGASVDSSFAVRVGITAWGSHWAMSAVAGTGVGYVVARDGRSPARRVAVAVGLWALAMAMHWFFNSPLGPGWRGTFAKIGVNLVVALFVYRYARRSYLTRFREVAAEEAATGAIRPDEAELLPRRHSRRRARNGPPQRAVRVLIGEIEEAQLALVAGRIPRADPEEPARSERLRAEIAALRPHLRSTPPGWPMQARQPIR
ncbi:PrsW family intramembrane metalloprotease [Embleya sp. NBC_00896]|uniref:PrsW family intramembrane metalloprotease n=1 Tax=Embleya sp. NBC_00896 TaxID=2975961 RepID=UPI00386D164F|nr:PrsW family intramembrane metalloprotease [Embleya sp. NBC_00896]